MRISSRRAPHGAGVVFFLSIVGTTGHVYGRQPDTGPTQQVLRDRAAGNPVNSAVQVLVPGGGRGSGSVIGKTNFGGGANEFVIVLTAAHVAENVKDNYRVRFGSLADGAQFVVGGAGSSAWQHPTIDVAVMKVIYGPANAFFNTLTPITRVNYALPAAPGALPPSVLNQFTEVGYGGTGNFVANGMDAVAFINNAPNVPARFSVTIDNEKRFQNNYLERTVADKNSSGRKNESYRSVEWNFNPAAAAGFLVAEGLSYAGDSGGPYYEYPGFAESQNVPAFNRPGPGTNNWAGGLMPLSANAQFAVHTYGNSQPFGNGRSVTFFSPYGAFGGGVPLTAALNGTIDNVVQGMVAATKGRCCLTNGTCVEVSSASCGHVSGTYGGDGTTCSLACPQPVVIYDNGPLSTGPTTASGVPAPAGTTWSEVQDDGGTTCTNDVAGFTCASLGTALGFRLADDFVVPTGQTWNITSVRVFAYQTNGAGLPFAAATLQIWNGRPDDPGSTVVHGNDTTNRLVSTAPANMYRAFNTTTPPPGTPPGTTRAIQQLDLKAEVSLGPGTYWIDFDTELTVEGGTHFAPSTTYVNLRGQPGANGRQFTPAGVWIDMVDPGNPAACADVLQDLPFKLLGTISGLCYANCDGSTGTPLLTPNDFACFLNAFVNQQSYADCDGVGGLTANDFACFLSSYVNGCS